MDASFDSIFEFLFKYRPILFRNGNLALDALISPVVLVSGAAVLAILVGWAYARAQGGGRDRLLLATLRFAALAVVIFCLARPVLRLPVVVPRENWLGILVDDSRSMRVADVEDGTRADWVERTFTASESELLARLSQRFRLRFYRFAEDAGRLSGTGALEFTGRRTRLGSALERAAADLASVPLSGLVLVTDGADNSGTTPAAALLALEAEGVPVFTVGVGREVLERDIEVVRVSVPASVLHGASPVADVVVRQNGYEGETVELRVEAGGRLLARRQIELGENGEARVVRVPIPAREVGPHQLRFSIAPRPGERIAENNARTARVVVRDRRVEILFFDGAPRYEVKFLRRAVEDDENLQLVTLVRIAEGRFMRLDVDEPEDLLGGFPTTREALFDYRGLILGSIEASYFTHAQLEMIADFVDRRGGGLLVLGGRRSLAEGGWAGTPVADVLPVVLDDRRRGDTTFFATLRVRPTRAGAAHPALSLADSGGESVTRWAELPPLTTVNRIEGLKAGATALLTGAGPAFPDGQVVLASQRYGRGRAVAFAVQDTWLWQMHADIAVDDRSHERLWRQLLRWLVSDVPERLIVDAPSGPILPGEPAVIRAELADSTYRSINAAPVVARVISPTGAVAEVPLAWTAERDGVYAGRFTPSDAGIYEVRVEASVEGVPVEADPVYFRAGDGNREFFDAHMHGSLLRRIAAETGGRFYTPETVSTLPEDIAYTARGMTVIEVKELWDMPINFILLVGFVLAEWAWRRRRGLV